MLAKLGAQVIAVSRTQSDLDSLKAEVGLNVEIIDSFVFLFRDQ